LDNKPCKYNKATEKFSDAGLISGCNNISITNGFDEEIIEKHLTTLS